MKFRRADNSYLEQLYDFGRRMYPERDNYRQIIDFWLSKGEKEIENVVIAVDDENKIRGQQFFSSMNYYYEGAKVDSVWAFDLIVDEELRAGSQGFGLMWKCKKIHSNSISSGSNDISLPINLKIGNTQIGELRKYVGIRNPFSLFTSLFRGEIAKDRYPCKVTVGYRSFEKITTAQELPVLIEPYNHHLLEIGREKEFLKWRFFSKLHDYVFYYDKESNDYFVVRSIVKKHVTALVLIDYRCNLTSTHACMDILEAFKSVAKKLNLAVLIVGSSVKMMDEACESQKMKSLGRPRPILGILDCNDKEELISNREFVLLTLADSDGDITW